MNFGKVSGQVSRTSRAHSRLQSQLSQSSLSRSPCNALHLLSSSCELFWSCRTGEVCGQLSLSCSRSQGRSRDSLALILRGLSTRERLFDVRPSQAPGAHQFCESCGSCNPSPDPVKLQNHRGQPLLAMLMSSQKPSVFLLTWSCVQKLTTSEFETAGDFLTRNCQTWTW